jgi:hypothetical protein
MVIWDTAVIFSMPFIALSFIPVSMAQVGGPGGHVGTLDCAADRHLVSRDAVLCDLDGQPPVPPSLWLRRFVNLCGRCEITTP